MLILLVLPQTGTKGAAPGAVSAMTQFFRATVVVTAIAALAGCHRKTDDINRNQQQYDVVTESAGGTVSSTVGAPAETATAVDTTTNFTLGTATSASATTGSDGSLADTLPPIAGASPVSRPPATDASRASATARRRSDQPSRSQADSPGTATMTPDRAQTTTSDEKQQRPARTQEPPPESPAQTAPESDPSKPPATDTTSTSPQR